MSAQPYDRSGKWLIQHHGDSILRLGGIRDIADWKPLQAELVQPAKLPDGLIEARRQGREEPDLFIVEILTYPDEALVEQVVRDMTLVYLDRRVLPEVLAIVLVPKGNLQGADSVEMASPLGWTKWRSMWKVVPLWSLPATDLLSQGDVGLIPWVPLTHFEGPPEPMFAECRARIDADAPADERENLLAVSQAPCRFTV